MAKSEITATKLTDGLETPQLMELYRQMVLIREFEDECYRQYMQGRIQGFLHVYSGEEAVGVGALSTLGAQDYVVTHYRDHGQALARGTDAKVIMAELFGKATGCSGGKGGSMHLFDVSRRFMGGYAIVGGQIPVAVGLALSARYQDNGSLVLCFMGDGAIQEGEFHEAMNLASIWKLPIIFLCENNLYGMGAAISTTFASHQEIYKFAEAYKMPGYRVDGMDLAKVREATLDIVKYVRNRSGPVFLEALTYRFRGHSISDPAGYRPQEEVDMWLERDPIKLLRDRLLREEIATEEEFQDIQESVEREILEAVHFALESPYPPPSDLYKDVYGK